jgi:hypothetical protein
MIAGMFMAPSPSRREAPSHYGAELHLSAEGRSWAIQPIVSIGCLLAQSGSIFEGQLGDAGFVELA